MTDYYLDNYPTWIFRHETDTELGQSRIFWKCLAWQLIWWAVAVPPMNDRRCCIFPQESEKLDQNFQKNLTKSHKSHKLQEDEWVGECVSLSHHKTSQKSHLRFSHHLILAEQCKNISKGMKSFYHCPFQCRKWRNCVKFIQCVLL